MKTLLKAAPLALVVLLPLALFGATPPKVAAVGFTVSDLDAEQVLDPDSHAFKIVEP